MRIKVTKRWIRVKHENLSDAWGYCILAPDKDPEILIHNRMSELKELEVLIHEATHLADWTLTEPQVDGVAKTASELLYKLGWRKHG